MLTSKTTEAMPWSDLASTSEEVPFSDGTLDHDVTSQEADFYQTSVDGYREVVTSSDSIILDALGTTLSKYVPTQVTRRPVSASSVDVTESISSTTESMATVSQTPELSTLPRVDETTQRSTDFTASGSSIWDFISDATTSSTGQETTSNGVTKDSTSILNSNMTDYGLSSQATGDPNGTTYAEITSDLATNFVNTTLEVTSTFNSTLMLTSESSSDAPTTDFTSSGNITNVMSTLQTVAGDVLYSTDLTSVVSDVKPEEAHGLSAMQIWFLVTGCFIGSVIILMFLNCLIEHRQKLASHVKKIRPAEELPRVSRIPTPPTDDDQVVTQTHMFQRHFLRKKY